LSFLVKYRLWAANEEHGNYIVTAFLGTSLPTGSVPNGAGHATFTPTLAAGKGWSAFSVQSTLAVTLPTAAVSVVGRPIAHNTAFQYHAGRFLWPELEINSTFWRSGSLSGNRQVFITPGLVIGRIPLKSHLRLSFGAGFQVAATHYQTTAWCSPCGFHFPNCQGE
jgi:hypothetical protein